MEIFISLGQWWANIISAAVSVINSAGMWISLEDNASAEWPCCEFLAVALWWAQRFAGAWIREKQVLRTAQPLTTKQLIIPSMLWSLASSVKQRHGWPRLKQTSSPSILYNAAEQRSKGKQWERESEELRESGGQEWRGKRESPLL